MNHLKTVAMALAAVISVLVASFHGDEHISTVEWTNIVLAAAGAVLVYLVPNLNAVAAVYTKGIVAFIVAAVAAIQNLYAEGITMTEWWQVIVAGLAAIGVVVAPGPIWDAIQRKPVDHGGNVTP